MDVREVIGRLSVDYSVISKTKLDESFPSAQFNIAIMKLEIEGIGIKMAMG